MVHDAKISYNNYFILCVNCPIIKSDREDVFIDEDFGPDDNEYYYDDHLEQWLVDE